MVRTAGSFGDPRDHSRVNLRSDLITLLPLVCLSCGQRVAHSPEPSLEPALCRWCLQALPWNPHACARCGRPHDRRGECHGCRDWPVTRTVAPLLYRGPVAGWVLRAKRSGGLPEARLLGRLTAAMALDVYPRDGLPEALLPVPLSWQRRLRRGHNQAERIAREAGRHAGIHVLTTMLARRRHTRRQPGLSTAERAANVRDAFVLRREVGRVHVAIVDDVMTSGATVLAIAALLADSCCRVDVWCAARADPTTN